MLLVVANVAEEKQSDPVVFATAAPIIIPVSRARGGAVCSYVKQIVEIDLILKHKWII